MRDLYSNVKVVEVVKAQTGGLEGTTIEREVDVSGFGSAMMIVSASDPSQETVLIADKEYRITGSGVVQTVNFDPKSSTVKVVCTIPQNQTSAVILLLGAPRYAPVEHEI